jgi:predicted transcriptional regulator
MNLREVCKILEAEIVWGAELLDRSAISVCGADLMSDVLAFTKDQTLLLTGLTNIQVVRTAEVSDLVGIIFVRGKRPNVELIQLAQSKGIPLLVTDHPMFEACGLLYAQGLKGCSQRVVKSGR